MNIRNSLYYIISVNKKGTKKSDLYTIFNEYRHTISSEEKKKKTSVPQGDSGSDFKSPR